MSRLHLHRLAAWLCVVALGLNATVFCRALVQCRDADGSMRLEWGCAKDDAGHCARICRAPDDGARGPELHSADERCDDEPVVSLPTAPARLSLKSLARVLADAPPPAPAAILPAAAPPPAAPAPAARSAPPPALRSLRSVILLV